MPEKRPKGSRPTLAWIDAHIAEHISLQRLCELAGVGGRGLQKAFQAVHCTSPMSYVLERRLAAARSRLIDALPEEGVTSIATTCGFTHFGRFALRYRKVYGELPSMTLSRCRSACGPQFAAYEGDHRNAVTTGPFAVGSQP